MNEASLHPSEVQLIAFNRGKLAATELCAISAHLDECQACCGRLHELAPADPVLNWLRQTVEQPLPLPPLVADGSNSADGSTQPESPDATAAQLPEGFGGYEILAEVGRGGMGVVYKARQRKLQRLVALKTILAQEHASSEQRLRFQREAELAAQLQHPHVVQVYEVGMNNGLPFLALEWVEGGTLARYLDGKPLAPIQAARLAETLARAVHAAHGHGVLHRDLKPANILLVGVSDELSPPTPIPKIADFGLARPLESTRGLTQTGAILGTPEYMAPEQALGRGREAGPAADTYSLGVILYEMMIGRPPFRAETPLATVRLVTDAEPAPPRLLNPGVPRDLEVICLKCLHKDPARRYVSAADLAEDLRRFQAGKPIAARPVGSGERLVKWARRRPATAALVAVSILAIVVVVTGTLFFIDQLTREKNAAVSAREAAVEAARHEAEARRDEKVQWDRAEELLYAAKLQLAQGAWNENNFSLAMQHLDSTRPEARGWEHRHLFTLFTSNQKDYPLHEDCVFGVSFSPNGQRLASAAGNNTVKIRDVARGEEIFALQGHTRRVTSVCFNPTGKSLATGSGDRLVKVWDAEKGHELFTLTGHTGGVQCVTFSRDGKLLASASADSTVRVWDVEKREALHTFKGHVGGVESVCFSPDGQRLASAGWDKTVKVWDVEKLREIRTLRGHTAQVYAVCFSPVGHTLVSGGGSYGRLGELIVWDDYGDKKARSLDGHLAPVSALDFSPDGKRLVTGSWDTTVKVWNTEAGQALRTFRGHRREVLGVRFDSDGKRIVSGGGNSYQAGWPGEVKVWDAEIAQEPPTLRGHTDSVAGICFSPDGRRLASASADGTVRIWDARRAREPRTLERFPGGVLAVGFSPDGKWLAAGGGNMAMLGQPGELKIFEAENGRVWRTLPGHEDWVTGVCFRPDGARLATASADQTVKVWDVQTGQEILTLQGHTQPVFQVCYSPDGKQLATCGQVPLGPPEPGEVKLWDAETGKEIRSFTGHDNGVIAVCFSGDGQRLASAGWDMTVKLWDVEKDAPLFTLEGHTEAVTGVCFTRDGKRLASVSHDRTVRLWNTDSGREVLTLKGHTQEVNAVCLSPDNRCLATASKDGTVKLWEAVREP